MRKLLSAIVAAALACTVLPSCGTDDDDNSIDLNDYKEWRARNDAWLAELQAKRNPDGTPYYTSVVPAWNPNVFVLMHFFNDRSLTAGNLVPLYTSTVDVRYVGHDCEGERFDSSTNVNQYGKLGVARFACNQVIQGWSIALENMHVGDTAEIIVPYNVAYGTSIQPKIKPYSTLRFNVRLEDIYKYEARN